MTEPTRASKFLAYVLRHAPARFGLSMEDGGWVDVAALLAVCNANGHPLTPALLASLVAQDTKQRYAFSVEGQRIRASQGHSVPVDLGYAPAEPPAILYHGTALQSLDTILREGLQKGQRHHVHLSLDAGTARAVGHRHGIPVVLLVEAGRLHRDGGLFYRSSNGIWLVESVPAQYLSVLPDAPLNRA
jgi:putative RNA 2'-phosphotransferase